MRVGFHPCWPYTEPSSRCSHDIQTAQPAYPTGVGGGRELAPRQDRDLALIYEAEQHKGNANRATLAVARKMVAYLVAIDRGGRDFVPAEEHSSAAA